MGTRQVYEEKLRAGNLQHDPTMNPGLGSARCPRCLSLINPNPEKGEWTITSVLHDAASVAGSGAGGLLSAIHSMNSGIPFIQQHVKGPKWLQFSVGIPSLLLYSGASAALGVCKAFIIYAFYFMAYKRLLIAPRAQWGAYLLPAFAQLSVSSYYAASSASYYAISRVTNHVEGSYLSQSSTKT
ncbi:hypothetical protein ZIOFF_021339 [Zingiber officinale]|uniref:Uncharacterized protein n=1 Tax=Zingiber officinale TaxID=94328 RepID=A0A8J5LLZ2_ZINOF|nr:hypothetical protein ZIOFF_021339 [Zingiber officinale]